MRRGSACDFGPPVFLQLVKNGRSRKLKLEHREERVSNRYKRSCICIAFVLVSALSLLAQSDRMEVKRGDDLQLKLSDRSRPLLTAALVEAPAVGNVSNDSELPDAPSSTKPDASTADPAASPVVKRQSHGAPPAALGGPLGVDRAVADRNYLALTGGMFGASIANAELTIRCLQVHASCNDVPSSLQSRAALYGIGIPADFGIAYLTYHMKKKHSRIWYLPAASVTVANVFLSVRAYRWMHD
jgi:hypothetical protein